MQRGRCLHSPTGERAALTSCRGSGGCRGNDSDEGGDSDDGDGNFTFGIIILSKIIFPPIITILRILFQ